MEHEAVLYRLSIYKEHIEILNAAATISEVEERFAETFGRRYAKTDEEVAAEVSAALKARIGVKPYQVIVHPDGGLDTRSEHKSKRIIDERKLDDII